MFYIWIIVFIIIDLLTKLIAKIYLWEKINLIGDFLYLKYVENTWIAFSIPIEWLILKILTIVLICIIFWYYQTEEKNKKNAKIDLAFILILSGSLWNGYERIFHSKVIDFIGVQYFSVFNIADVWITLWVCLYIYVLIFLSKKQDV